MALSLPLDNAGGFAMSIGESSTVATSGSEGQERPRGKFVGKTFDAKDLYEAYKEVETEYHAKAFKSSGWRVLASRQQVEVSLLEHSSDPSCPYIKMVAVIPASVQDCWDWLSLHNWPTNMPKMDPFYEGLELHGDYNHKGVNMILARKRTKRILAFGKRDMVFLSVSDRPLSDGTWVSGSVSVQTPRLPRQSGYTRAFQDSIAFYKPLKRNTKTRLTIVCRIDLNDNSADGSGGWIPMWVYVKTIGSTGLRSVTSMRDMIMKQSKPKAKAINRTDHEIKDIPRWGRLWERLDSSLGGKNSVRKHGLPEPLEGRKWQWKHRVHKSNQEFAKTPIATQDCTEEKKTSPELSRHHAPTFFLKRFFKR